MQPTLIPDGAADQLTGGRRIVFGPPDGDPTGDVRACEGIVHDGGIAILIELDDADRALAAAGRPMWLHLAAPRLVPFATAFDEGAQP